LFSPAFIYRKYHEFCILHGGGSRKLIARPVPSGVEYFVRMQRVSNLF